MQPSFLQPPPNFSQPPPFVAGVPGKDTDDRDRDRDRRDRDRSSRERERDRDKDRRRGDRDRDRRGRDRWGDRDRRDRDRDRERGRSREKDRDERDAGPSKPNQENKEDGDKDGPKLSLADRLLSLANMGRGANRRNNDKDGEKHDDDKPMSLLDMPKLAPPDSKGAQGPPDGPFPLRVPPGLLLGLSSQFCPSTLSSIQSLTLCFRSQVVLECLDRGDLQGALLVDLEVHLWDPLG